MGEWCPVGSSAPVSLLQARGARRPRNAPKKKKTSSPLRKTTSQTKQFKDRDTRSKLTVLVPIKGWFLFFFFFLFFLETICDKFLTPEPALILVNNRKERATPTIEWSAASGQSD